MEKISSKELMRRVKHLCGGSIDLTDVQNEKSLGVLNACLHNEVQHRKRVTMIQNLKSRIRGLEKI